MHVVFLHPAVLLDDQTERLLASVRAAVAVGARVTVLTGRGTRLPTLVDAGAEVGLGELPTAQVTGYLAARRTRARLAELAPDLLHATHEALGPLAATLAESLRVPYVLEVTRPLAVPIPTRSGWLRSVVLPCATFVENAVNRGQVPRSTLRVVEHGPPLRRDWLPRPLEGVRTPVIAHLGSLDELHGTSVLVEAARLLKESGRDLRVLILGEGSAEEEVRRRVRELGLSSIVTVACPSVPDLAEVLGKVDLFASCVLGGSPGWCAVQALGLGIPSVFSAVGGSYPLVEDRRNGLLCERNTPDKLAEALATLLDNRPAAVQMGAAARQGLRAKGIEHRYAEELVGTHQGAVSGARS